LQVFDSEGELSGLDSMSSIPAAATKNCMEQLRPLVEDPGNDGHFSWPGTPRKFTILGREFTGQRFGLCMLDRIIFTVEDGEKQREIYRLDLMEDYKTRYEFYLGRRIRVYRNEHPCFIEFMDLANRIEGVPTLDEAKISLKLGKRVSGKYRQMLESLLQNNLTN